MTIMEFIKANKITMSARSTGNNPFMALEAGHYMDHWRVTLYSGDRKRMSVYFSMGAGLNGKEPEAADVLGSLASDSASAGESFESWASEYGYDADSRKAEKTWKACRQIATKLQKFLGADGFAALLNAERL